MRVPGQLLLGGEVLEHGLGAGPDGLQADHLVGMLLPGVQGLDQLLHRHAVPVVACRGRQGQQSGFKGISMLKNIPSLFFSFFFNTSSDS